jgi:hypothetical protein
LEQPAAEKRIGELLRDAVNQVVDATFLAAACGADPFVDGADSPADLLNAVNIAVTALVAGGGDARTISLAAHPTTLAQMALTNTTAGERAFPDVTCFGGSLGGLPLLASLGAAEGRLYAVSGNSVIRGPFSVRLEASIDASLEMDTEPTQTAEPGQDLVGASAHIVSMFQTDMVAIRQILEFAYAFNATLPGVFIDNVDLAGTTA